MNKKIKRLVEISIAADANLRDGLDALSGGGECDCEFPTEIVLLIHEGEFDELEKYCCECGGVVV